MWLRWLRMRLLRFLGVVMSDRYRLLLILINTLERLSVNEKGITFIPSFLTMYEEELRGGILAATVMAAADVQIKK